MGISALTGAGSLGALYGTTGKIASSRQAESQPSAIFAGTETVSISQVALNRLAAERADTSSTTAQVVRHVSALMDTDKGSVAVDIEDYFSATPRPADAEIPPLLMPTQGNIDSLEQHISEIFPTYLAEHRIPYAPASIHYDSQGQPRFPADYPYAAQLRQAFEESPSIAKEIQTAYALSDSKAALDEAAPFQQAYRQASNQQALEVVLAKYSALLSDGPRASPTSATFTPEGRLSIRASGSAIPSGSPR